MKKVNFLFLSGLLSVMAFSLSACSEEGSFGSESYLVGTWECTYDYYAYYENGELKHEEVNEENGHRITFNSDGTCVTSEAGGVYWSYDNGAITLTYDVYDTPKIIPLKELTNSKMIIEMTDEFTEGGIPCKDYTYMEYAKISD